MTKLGWAVVHLVEHWCHQVQRSCSDLDSSLHSSPAGSMFQKWSRSTDIFLSVSLCHTTPLNFSLSCSIRNEKKNDKIAAHWQYSNPSSTQFRGEASISRICPLNKWIWNPGGGTVVKFQTFSFQYFIYFIDGEIDRQTDRQTDPRPLFSFGLWWHRLQSLMHEYPLQNQY